MKTIYKLLLLVALLHCVANVDAKKKFGEVIFTDSISGTEIIFNEAKIYSIPNEDNCRMVIDTKESTIYVYTVENSQDRTYKWSEVNQFDADFRFGNLITSEKLEFENADGWIRYYQMPSKKGKMILSCVSVIRGNSYAIYIVEQLSPEKTPVTPEIVKNTEFKKVTGKRIENDGRVPSNLWIWYAIFALSSIIIKFLFWDKTKLKTIIFIIAHVAFFIVVYFILLYSLSTTLISLGGSAIVWGLVLYFVNSWDDLWNIIGQGLSEIG